ncbi:MAG: hypothetical protein J0I79_16555 [Mesorhizobium sp.]|uniref:hypothetical protein n=1 Tax=Mesorhizobium sp. TaxID=1871066 RepID=UPI001AD2BDC4|nr:hypothetical protein [Mesorhizobium sp.]MBN9219558.1 hypothetical protein [Mesorhizobium sp.]
MSELDDIRDKWIAAEQAAYDAWTAVSRTPLWKEHRHLRKKAKEAKERFRAAWIASQSTNESLQHEETVQG